VVETIYNVRLQVGKRILQESGYEAAQEILVGSPGRSLLRAINWFCDFSGLDKIEHARQ